ncbi:hypothetical protein GCM10025777_23530 [Membranihabitans marinus]
MMATMPSFCLRKESENYRQDWELITSEVENSTPVKLEGNKRIAFGWQADQISPGQTITLKPSKQLPIQDIYFRMTPAVEIWSIMLLHLYTAENDSYIGTLDIRYTSVLVPYEIKIDATHISAINQTGLKIKLEADHPFGYFSKVSIKDENQVFNPHFLSAQNEKGDLDDFLKCFMSLNSIQAFGWREGTVLDGLWQLYSQKNEEKALEALEKHLDLFNDDNDVMRYETARNEPKNNELDGIESTIPIATIARVKPNHPILKKVLLAWDDYTMDNGMITGGSSLTAEGCYTVAYPLAVLGKKRNDGEMMQKALDQLRHRFVLIDGHDLNLRYHTNSDNYTYKNWARGGAWTLLGFVRTIVEIQDVMRDEEVEQKFRQGVDNALRMQQSNGLWNGFMDSNNAVDTSGSAGMSAAILIGVKAGLLPSSYKEHAVKCWHGLQDYITPDGFLKSVSQDNRGGVKLQESDYRVISQMGMGMMAQLYAYMDL